MGQASRAVLIVEDEAELRGLTAALLEDGELDTIECESAEAALAIMLIRGRDVAMIFVTSPMLRQASGFDGSAHHLPLPYADSSLAMIVASSSDSLGSEGVTITSNVFRTLISRRWSAGRSTASNRVDSFAKRPMAS